MLMSAAAEAPPTSYSCVADDKVIRATTAVRMVGRCSGRSCVHDPASCAIFHAASKGYLSRRLGSMNFGSFSFPFGDVSTGSKKLTRAPGSFSRHVTLEGVASPVMVDAPLIIASLPDRISNRTTPKA